jgi:hypothetical protein
MDCEWYYCAAVVDAGSSGSRIHWYSYDLDRQHNPIHIREAYSKKIKPGLASIAQDSVTVAGYMDELMHDFSQPNVPVYLYATAGMRLLPVDSQEQYYTEIKQWFAEHPQWPLRDARTISGMEEGIYGWLSLNYHLHALQDKSQPLVGLVEVGGASAQIVFPVRDTTGIDAQDYVNLTVYGRHIHLFSHSFLGLGINELFVHSQHYPACFPNDYPLQNGALGLGDAEQCQAEMGAVLQQDYHTDAVTSSALQHNTAPLWFTVSAVSALAANPPFEFSDQAFTGPALLKQANQNYCQQSYPNLVTQYPDNDYIQKNCLLASYFSGLLVYGLGFGSDQAIHYAPDYDGSWTLGVLLPIHNHPTIWM